MNSACWNWDSSSQSCPKPQSRNCWSQDSILLTEQVSFYFTSSSVTLLTEVTPWSTGCFKHFLSQHLRTWRIVTAIQNRLPSLAVGGFSAQPTPVGCQPSPLDEELASSTLQFQPLSLPSEDWGQQPLATCSQWCFLDCRGVSPWK